MQEGQDPTRFTMPAGLAELAAELEHGWPAMQAALRASGVPLNEGDGGESGGEGGGEGGESGAGAGGQGGAGGGGEEKPPWGDDFDAERAWKLVTNLRRDTEKFKGERDQLRTKVKEHEDATKSEQQKAAEAAQAAQQQAEAATRDAARLRVALKKGLTETQAKRLVGDTVEELEADADELLASFKQESDAGGDKNRRPRERLRTGAAPSSEPEETDPGKLAAMVPRRY